MINANEVAGRRNEKLFNKLSDLIDKKIIDLAEPENGDNFTFDLHKSTPNAVVDLLINAYRQNGWTVNLVESTPSHRRLSFSVTKIPDIVKNYHFMSHLERIFMIDETADVPFQGSMSGEIPDTKDIMELSKLSDKLSRFDSEVLLGLLNSGESKIGDTIFTYVPSFHLALADSCAKLKLPTKMLISHKMYQYLFRGGLSQEQLHIIDFNVSTHREILMTGLYGHISTMDVYVFDDHEFKDQANDIYVFDTIFASPVAKKQEEVRQVDDGYILDYHVYAKLNGFVHIHVYR